MRASHNAIYFSTEDAYITRYGGYRKVKKVYVGDENGIARICYNGLATITYKTNLDTTFTTKDVLILDKYGSMPITADSARVDFWFKPNSVAKKDSSKKYIDYPWCAYADANPSLYSSYGYKEDRLAKHWNEVGRSGNYDLGCITKNSICTTREDHIL